MKKYQYYDLPYYPDPRDLLWQADFIQVYLCGFEWLKDINVNRVSLESWGHQCWLSYLYVMAGKTEKEENIVKPLHMRDFCKRFKIDVSKLLQIFESEYLRQHNSFDDDHQKMLMLYYLQLKGER